MNTIKFNEYNFIIIEIIIIQINWTLNTWVEEPVEGALYPLLDRPQGAGQGVVLNQTHQPSLP